MTGLVLAFGRESLTGLLVVPEFGFRVWATGLDALNMHPVHVEGSVATPGMERNRPKQTQTHRSERHAHRGFLNAREALHALIGALHDRQDRVVESASEAIQKIGVTDGTES
jgi:hypothetical protein